MDHKQSYYKLLFGTIFIAVASIITYIGFNEVYAQSGNQSSSSSHQSGPNVPYHPGPNSNPHLYPPFNQSKIFPNNTENLKSLKNLTGSNTPFLEGKPVSNPKNSLANSLSTNSFQNH